MSVKRSTYLICLLSLALSGSLAAQNLFVADTTKEPIRIGGKFQYFFDKTHSLSLDNKDKI
jgi:hypothetical protein